MKFGAGGHWARKTKRSKCDGRIVESVGLSLDPCCRVAYRSIPVTYLKKIPASYIVGRGRRIQNS